MGGMLRLRADKWMRVGAGFGFVLLLAVQEKVCPWLTTPPAPAPQNSDSQPGQKKSRPVLPVILPDTAAPRLQNAGTPGPSITARDGVVSCGQQSPTTPPSADVPAPASAGWRQLQTPAACATAPLTLRWETPRDPAVRTALRRTGPPPA
jgi:hypothetical protein